MNIRETALAELPREVILTGSPTGKRVSGSGVWFSLVNRVVNSLNYIGNYSFHFAQVPS